MIPIPMPYPYPSSGSDCEYAYPEWVAFFVNISVVIIVVGLIGVLISIFMLLICEITDNDDAFDRIATPTFMISSATAVVGLVLALIGVFIMAITGTKI